MLDIESINIYYSEVHVLKDVSIIVDDREFVSVIGGNGAGKTTLLNSIGGFIPLKSGKIKFQNKEIQNIPAHSIVEMGLSQVSGERSIFTKMSVRDNLLLGGWVQKDTTKIKNLLEKVMDMFPILGERKSQIAGNLSGGEQQMLAIARALMAEPKMLMLDEPSFGLAPKIVAEVFETIQKINESGVSIFLVEQDVHMSLSIAHRAYVLENGQVVMEGKGKELLNNDHVRKAYLGI
ncbi:MAG: ABC transporter ATP-binding protein [Syntrophales bacterium]|jgi:branched-chain amino acid transport system ATP-binding protein|nr:ABC transporter ATP-binding protein [Syntrophales bacterium]MDY0044111.1 ABC transporter ATP-binding protein [Syntrophales bacterium]